MAKAKKYLNLDKMVMTALQDWGYKPEIEEDDEGTQVDCLINGTSVAVYYGVDSETVGYGIIFEPQEEIDDDTFFAIVEGLKSEEQPFDNLMEDEDALLHLEGEVDLEDFTEDFLKFVVDVIERKDGAISKLKAVSYVWEE